MEKNNTDVDRLFKQGVSDVSRAPRQMLTDAEIASAAAASKAGAGIWLLSHAKELLIGAVSFAVGVGTTLLVTHALQDQAPLQLPAEQTALVTADSLSEETLSKDTTIYPAETSGQTIVRPENEPTSSSNDPKASSPEQETVTTAAPKTATRPATSEPVVIKKTIVRRDTVRLRETIVVKDTVYEIGN